MIFPTEYEELNPTESQLDAVIDYIFAESGALASCGHQGRERVAAKLIQIRVQQSILHQTPFSALFSVHLKTPKVGAISLIV
jgi:hypothetical protein